MGAKMKKGLFKPLRYFSQMFDNKEPELQIGFPTDVKHVAHIGWDGPNVNAPTWLSEHGQMKEFHSAPLSSPSCAEGREIPETNPWGSQEFVRVGDCPNQQGAAPHGNSSSSVDNGVESSNSTTSGKPRHSRRHQSDGTITDSPGRDGAEESRRGRRHRKKEGTAADSPAQDLPAIPKQSHRRKAKGSSGSGGSVRSSKSKTDAVAEGCSAEPMPKLHEVAGKDEEEL